MRALGLEPSLIRGKSPVPYLSGVTRVVGREGIEPPVSEDGWSTASCAPWRDRPISRPGGAGLDDDVSAVVNVLVSRLVAGRVGAGSEGVELSVVGVGDRDTAVARAQGGQLAHDVVRSEDETSDAGGEKRSDYQRATGLPASAALRPPGFDS